MMIDKTNFYDARNAKQELLEALTDKAKVKCALLWWFKDHIQIRNVLKVNHSPADMEVFLNALDFEYDAGHYTQELFGTVWLEDGSWLRRDEYDGAEQWEHLFTPPLPEECL